MIEAEFQCDNNISYTKSNLFTLKLRQPCNCIVKLIGQGDMPWCLESSSQTYPLHL